MGKGRGKFTITGNTALMHCMYLKRLLFSLIFLVIGGAAFGQTKVEVLNADYLDYKEAVYGKVRRLIGNVGFRQDDVTMYCDSAYQNEEDNSFKAFNNIRIYQGDSVSMFGDTLDYDGNLRKALLRGKTVTLHDGDMTLTTDIINYDANEGIGYYTTGGHIVNKENNLTSTIGTYDTKSKTFGFKDSVVLKNPEYTMYCDTLQYNTASRYAYFFGPTRIYDNSDSSMVYCENGWYNTAINYSQFSKNSYILTKDKKLSADSMVYTGKTGIDQAYRNILLVDTTNKIEIRGQRGTYNRNTNQAWVTEAASGAIKVEDDTLFMTADTLKTWYDSTRKNRTLYAYHNTRYFKKDMQGLCDSLQYSFNDSVINMEGSPVLWSEQNQITADTIRVYMKNGQINRLEMLKNTFVVSEKDTTKYNQVRGRNAEGYFKDRKLREVLVNSDVENIYYIEEDTGKYIGMNKIVCGNLKLVIHENKVHEVRYYNGPTGNMYPMDQLPAEVRLKGFKWLKEKRPLSKADVTPVYIPKKEEPKEKPKEKPKPKQEKKKK